MKNYTDIKPIDRVESEVHTSYLGEARCNLNVVYDTFHIAFDKLKIGREEPEEYSLKKIFDVLEDRRWSIFNSILEENEIKYGNDFDHFQAFVHEHCTNKGITDYASIRKLWKEHLDSIKKALSKIKEEFNKRDTDGSI